MSEDNLAAIECCPACGALPCDWSTNPHTPSPTTGPLKTWPPVSEAAREAAEQAVSVANIVSHDGYYEVDADAVAQVVAAFEQSKDAAFVAMLEGMKRDSLPGLNAVIDEAIANAKALGEGRAGS